MGKWVCTRYPKDIEHVPKLGSLYDDSPWTEEGMSLLAAPDSDVLGWEGMEAYQDRDS